MRLEYFQKTAITSVLLFSFCISIPEKPKSETDECVSQFFHAHKRMKEVEMRQRHLVAGIMGGSFGVAFWMGPVALAPILILPFTRYWNKEEVEEIRIDYEEKYCKEPIPPEEV